MTCGPSARQTAFGGTGVSVLGSTIAPADADAVVRPTVPLASTSTTAVANVVSVATSNFCTLFLFRTAGLELTFIGASFIAVGRAPGHRGPDHLRRHRRLHHSFGARC